MNPSRPRRHPLVYVAPRAEDLLAECLPRLTRLRDEGFAVCIATPHTPALDDFAGHGFEVRPLPGRDRWNVAGQLAAYPILQAQFLEDRPALVHGFGAPWAWIAAYAAHRASVPAVLATIEDHDFSRPIRVRSYRKLAQWLHGYVVHHEADLRELLDREVASRHQVELLLGGRGIDLHAFAPDDEELVPVPRPPRARVVLGGRPSAGLEAVKRQVARAHPGVGWLDVEGPVTAPMLATMDAFVSLDSTDAVGTDLMAAAAMRIIAVAVESAAARTVIVDHETGRIAQPDAVAKAISEVLGDPKRMADMSIRARARAEQRFDRTQIDEQLLTIYDRLLDAKNL